MGRSFQNNGVCIEPYSTQSTPEQALVHDTVEPSELWHRRLAHVHYRALPIASKDVEVLLEFQAKT